MQNAKILYLSGFCVFVLGACAPVGKSASSVAASAIDQLGCKTAQSEMWNSFQAVADEGGSFATSEELRKAFLKMGKDKGFTGAAFENYVNAFSENYSATISGIENSLAPADPLAWKKALAQMEVGIRETPAHVDLQNKIQASMEQLKGAEAALNAQCEQPEPPTYIPETITPHDTYADVWQQLKATSAPEVYGVRRAMAVAYQSCDVLSLPPMITRTPDVVGIKRIGIHPGGIGQIRKIDNLANVVATDYYIKGMSLPKSSCFEVRHDPPIYNFGGKPFTSSGLPKELNMFKHVDAGGPTLGIDCSGFVFSALAVAGLKMSPDPKKPLKADLVWAIGSSAYMDPQSNGMSCLEKITVSRSSTILAGDIMAMNGHVIMIDEVSADPFGLGGLKSLSDCNSSKIQTQNFSFIIAQSAPIKNGIGINRIHAADYLADGGTIPDGFVRYAIAACRAKFNAAPNLNSPKAVIVRHKKTPECRGEPLHFTRSECVDSCRAL